MNPSCADSQFNSPSPGCVAFIDSGVGGVPYTRRSRELMPELSYLYLADLAHFPYGEKSEEEVRQVVIQSVDLLKPFQPGLLVIACNTASVTALEEVRRHVNYPVIGVVPAVKPAAQVSRGKSVALMATERTLAGGYLEQLIQDFAPHHYIVRHPASDLVRFVEERMPQASREEREAALLPHVRFLLSQNVDTLVLGCTHFLYLGEELRRLLGEAVQVVDSLEGVARRVQYIAAREKLTSPRPEALFYHTGALGEKYNSLIDWGGLTMAGRLE